MSVIEGPWPAIASTADPRFTLPLLVEVRQVLERHGYVCSPQACDASLIAFHKFTRAFEGRP